MKSPRYVSAVPTLLICILLPALMLTVNWNRVSDNLGLWLGNGHDSQLSDESSAENSYLAIRAKALQIETTQSPQPYPSNQRVVEKDSRQFLKQDSLSSTVDTEGRLEGRGSSYGGDDFVYKNRKWGGECPEIKYKININTDQADQGDGTTEEFRQAIINAAKAWGGVSGADFRLTYDGVTDATTTGYNGTNEVIFSAEGLDSPSGLARIWFTTDFIILEADIWINSDYNWDATGSPDSSEVDLQSVALHEFGHWLALGHDDSIGAIMYETVTIGTVKRELHQNEINGISFVYPRPDGSNCPQGEGPPNSAPTATPTTPHSPTMTIPPTATPTPQEQLLPSISVNHPNGSPGSFFTLGGSNYGSNQALTVIITDRNDVKIEANQEGAFTIVLDTHSAAPGIYTIDVPSLPNMVSGTLTPTTRVSSETVSIVLDSSHALRAQEIPSRSGALPIFELALNENATALFLPFVR